MLEKYKKFFEIYLKICKEKYDIKNPYDNLEDCCKTCEHLEYKLFGMLDLIEELNEITKDELEKERQNIINTFSTIDLYNCYMDDGEVLVYSKRGVD